jgi:predicted unusual protein kinase regulating ubiquinone biosynthesis (AarF/ABC1/UbiB family)
MFVREFEGLLYEMPFQIPQNFILLGRCASILSGMCSALNPSFNVWAAISPYAEKLVREEATTGLDFWLKQVLEILRTLAALPQKMDRLLNRLERGKLEVQNRDLKLQMTRMERSQRRLTGAVLFATFFIGSVQLYLAGDQFLAGAGALAALLSLGFTLFTRRPNL